VLVRLLGQASPIPFALCEVANQAWAITKVSSIRNGEVWVRMLFWRGGVVGAFEIQLRCHAPKWTRLNARRGGRSASSRVFFCNFQPQKAGI
jgi:hypothetical protein